MQAVDRVRLAMLETAQVSPTSTWGAPERLSRRDHYSLLVIRGDGARILRVTIPRRLATAALVAGLVTLSAAVALLGDYVQLRKLTSEARGYLSQIAQHQRIMTRVSERVA